MKNILVYVKTPKDKKFTALSSLKDFTYLFFNVRLCISL